MSAAADHRRARATSFGAAADAYERGRPTYPDAAVDWMLATILPRAAGEGDHPKDGGGGSRRPDLGRQSEPATPNALEAAAPSTAFGGPPPPFHGGGCAHPARVLDLGAGTGKLTRSLVARGLDTLAVDPSPEMLARLAASLPEVATHVGTAEAIPLPDAHVDAVVVGQAWHWVEPARAVPEIARVLRPGGTLALVWNIRDDTLDWVRRLNDLVDRGKYDPSYTSTPVVEPPFGAIEQHDLAWTYRLDEAGLIDLAGSRSIAIMLPPEERAALDAQLRALFAEVAGGTERLAIPYLTHAFRAVLPPAAQ